MMQNWAGNITYHAKQLHTPNTLAHLQEIVAHSQQVRVLGTRHSFNAITDSHQDLISLENLPQDITIDRHTHTATVPAGITYGALALRLQQDGYALHNMASLPHITVAGAVNTGTHGSGNTNGNLATAVVGLELVAANGDVVHLSPSTHAQHFAGAVVGLGALGVITQITLALQPTFDMQQVVYEQVPLAQVETNFEAITNSAYSVSVFTDWQTKHTSQIWLKHKITNDTLRKFPTELFSGQLAKKTAHPVPNVPAEPCSLQLGARGAWHECLPHFRLSHRPSFGDELQSEYFVPRQHAINAMHAIAALSKHLQPVLLVSEIRTIAADTLWLSGSYARETVGFHFTWRQNEQAVQAVLVQLENVLAPFQARPHWGKLFAMPAAQVQALYPKFNDFQTLIHTFDPTQKFVNAFLRNYI